MAEYIVRIKKKTDEKVDIKFLSNLEIDFYTEAQEEEAFYRAMLADRKTSILDNIEKEHFIKQLKSAK